MKHVPEGLDAKPSTAIAAHVVYSTTVIPGLCLGHSKAPVFACWPHACQLFYSFSKSQSRPLCSVLTRFRKEMRSLRADGTPAPRAAKGGGEGGEGGEGEVYGGGIAGDWEALAGLWMGRAVRMAAT